MCKQSQYGVCCVKFLPQDTSQLRVRILIAQRWHWGNGSLNLSFWKGSRPREDWIPTFTRLEKKKKLIGNCSWEKIKDLGSVEGEMGWFLNQFLNHKALSVGSAQSVKAFPGYRTYLTYRLRWKKNQDVREKFNEQFSGDFLKLDLISLLLQKLKRKKGKNCQ